MSGTFKDKKLVAWAVVGFLVVGLLTIVIALPILLVAYVSISSGVGFLQGFGAFLILAGTLIAGLVAFIIVYVRAATKRGKLIG